MQTSSRMGLRLLAAAGLLLLSLMQAIPALAQGQTITGSGTVSGGPLPFSPDLSLTFPPAGGPVSGVISGQRPFMNGAETCTQSMSGTADGNFAGGDNGAASGSMTINYKVTCSGGSNTQTFSGTWQGTLRADGNGSGTWSSAYGGGSWQVSYSAADFRAIIAPPTLDYLYFWNTYGINLQDGDKEWSDQDMRLLDEALREVPREWLDRLPVRALKRYAAAWDENWNTRPGVRGEYYWSDLPDRPSQLQIYDAAYDGNYYNDRSGHAKFKATLIHELTHSLQERDPQGQADATLQNPYTNPLVVQYMSAAAPQADPNNPNYYYGWYWNIDGNKKWMFFESPDAAARNNAPPYRTGDNRNYQPYARTNPMEDMAVSVEMYMYDARNLRAQSPARYEFIRDNIFGGVEYENGVRVR